MNEGFLKDLKKSFSQSQFSKDEENKMIPIAKKVIDDAKYAKLKKCCSFLNSPKDYVPDGVNPKYLKTDRNMIIANINYGTLYASFTADTANSETDKIMGSYEKDLLSALQNDGVSASGVIVDATCIIIKK